MRIGILQFEIIITLIEHPHDAHSATIRARIQQLSGNNPTVSTVYTTLKKMERNGLVSSSWGEPSKTPGGRRKHLYKIEPAGEAAAKRFAARMVHHHRPMLQVKSSCYNSDT